MDTDTRYKLMADARRRAVVAILDPDESPVALADLARQVAARETEGPTDGEREPSSIQSTYLSLYHVHVPKLADAGVVSFDADRKTVTAGPRFDAVQSFTDGQRKALEEVRL